MDDDDLTQDILDQFDLICTQHQSVRVESKKAEKSVKFGTERNLPNTNLLTAFVVKNESTAVLERSTSLGNCIDGKEQQIYRSPGCGTMLTALDREEVEELKKEVSNLKEELYMKLGELATLKESANRSDAAKTDIIQRLETSLTAERSEFDRKLSELNAQIAFREADYRLVCTELTRVKGQLNANKVTFDHSVDYSPASQIIATMVASPQPDLHNTARKSCTPSRVPLPDYHLPSPVTPVPSRKAQNYTNGTWNIALPTVAEVKRSGQADKPALNSPTCSRANQDLIKRPAGRRGLATTDDDNDDNDDDLGLSETPRKRRRRHTMADQTDLANSPKFPLHTAVTIGKSYSDVAVETSDLVPEVCTRLKGLPFRVRMDRSNDDKCLVVPQVTNPLPTTVCLAADLLLTTISDSPKKFIDMCSPNPNTTSQPTTHPSAESIWQMADQFMMGVRCLLGSAVPWDPKLGDLHQMRRSVQIEALVTRLDAAFPHVVRKLEDQINSCILKVPDSVQDLPDTLTCSVDDDTKENNDPSSDDNDGSTNQPTNENEISYLDEDPFAGAPASQVVTSFSHPSAYDARILHSPKRLPLTKNKSCPSTLNLSRLVSPKPIHRFQDPDLDRPKSKYDLWIDRALNAMTKLYRLAETLSLCVLICTNPRIDVVQDHPSMNPSDRSRLVRLRIRGMVRHLIGIVARFLKRTAQLNVLVHASNHNSNNGTKPPSLCTTQQQLSHVPLQLQPHGNDQLVVPSLTGPNSTPLVLSQSNCATPSSLWFPPQMITSCLNLGAYLVQWMDPSVLPSEAQLDASDPWGGTDPIPDRISCMISAFEACVSHPNPGLPQPTPGWDHRLGRSNLPRTHLITLDPVIALFQLYQHMISSGYWLVGHYHASDPSNWSCTSRSAVDSDLGLSQDTLLSYFQSMYGISTRCPLHAMLVWIKRISSDYLTYKHKTISPISKSTEPHSDQSDSIGLGQCSMGAELLFQFSGFVAALARSDEVNWSDSCPCKSQIYSTLVGLAINPFHHLLTIPSTLTHDVPGPGTRHLLNQQKSLIRALGQFTRALLALLWRHGYNAFQLYTDCLPAYFYLIANLSLWTQRSKILTGRIPAKTRTWTGRHANPKLESADLIHLRPELVEELYDFDPGSEPGSSNPTV